MSVIITARLALRPLSSADLERLFPVLNDSSLHEFTGGEPRSRDELARWINAVSAGGPSDKSERWLNWVVRRRVDGEVVGTMQATIVGDWASIAWVVGTAFQGRGYAKEAAAGVAGWLRTEDGVVRLRAAIHPDHLASQAVARALELAPTDEIDDDEIVWRSTP